MAVVSGAGRTGRAADVAIRLVWLAGTALFAAIAALALWRLGELIVAQRLAAIPWLLAAALVTSAAAALAVGSLRVRIRGFAPALGLAAIAAPRLLEIALVRTPLASDFARYNELAADIARHGFAFSSVPTGWPALLAVPYAVLGPDPVLGELLNVAMAVGTGWLVFDVALRTFGRRAAIVALWLIALSPAQILMTSVLASEGPYALLVALAVWLTVRFVEAGDRRPVLAFALAAATGLALAASQYVRTTTPAIAPAFVVLPPLVALAPGMRSAMRARVAFVSAAVVAAVFVLALLPVVAWNLETKGELSITPSNFGGWSLLVGTSGNGEYNGRLAAEIPAPAGSVEFDRIAGERARKQLLANPGGFARLAVRKFPEMWADEQYGVTWAFRGLVETGSAGWLLASQLAYAAAAALALAAIVAVRRRPPPVVVLVVLVAGALAVVHTFVEVQPRYHAYLVPLFCLLGGAGLEWLLRSLPFTARRSARTAAARARET